MVMPRFDDLMSDNSQDQNVDSLPKGLDLKKMQDIMNQQTETQDNEPDQQEEEPSWGDFLTPSTYQGEPDPVAEEESLSYFLRNATANASRVLEQGIGRYGNVEKMGKDLLANIPESGGMLASAINQLIGPERWERMVRGKPGFEQMLPTSEDLKNASQVISDGYTTPKTPGEAKFQKGVEDIAAITNRRTLRQTPRDFLVNNLAIPAAANVVEDLVDDMGFGKDKATKAKLAFWIPMGLAYNVNGSRYAADLMNQGRNGFGNNVTADIPRYTNRLNTASRHFLQGDPRSALAQQQVAGITNDIANGRTTMRDLMNRYDALNAAKRDRGLFELNPGDRAAAIRYINQVRDVVGNEIRTLGAAANPGALRAWENGVQAFSVIHRSNALTNWVQNIAKGPYAKMISGPAAALFGVGTLGALKTPLIGAPATAIAGAGYKTGQVLYRVSQSPQLSSYYWNAIQAAQNENIPAFINNYNRLNKALEKSESTDKVSKTNKSN